MENKEIKTSKKRIIGSALFGLILGGYFYKAFDYTIPRIFSIVKKVSVEEGNEIYANSIILSLILTIFTVFIAAAVAGFLAKKKGILVGLLAGSIYIILFGFAFVLSLLMGESAYIGSVSAQLYAFLGFILAIIASVFGGYFGEKCYSPERDLDSGKNRLTIFGIRWFHYFWIFPIVLYSFLATLIIAIHAGILVFLNGFYFTFHPSLWLKFSWLAFMFFVPILGFIPIYLLGFAFVRFWELMQYKQDSSKGWKRFGKILLYGIGAPGLASLIAYTVAEIAHNMPRPITGDWKIGIGFALLVPSIALIVYIFSWIKNKFSKKTDNL